MRLEISRRSDLALRALRWLAASGEREKRERLAEAVGTSPDFAARVMGPLVHAGWVYSETGRHGGYLLVADLADVSVLEVIEATEGPLDPDRCVLRGGPCEVPEPCALHEAWARARQAMLQQLMATPVA
jgi:Rrf2 family protein